MRNRKAVRQIQNRMAMAGNPAYEIDPILQAMFDAAKRGDVYVPPDHDPRMNQELEAMRLRRVGQMQSLARFTEASYLVGKTECTSTKPAARTSRQAEVDQSIKLHEGRPPWLATR